MGEVWKFYWPAVKVMPKILIKSAHWIECSLLIAGLITCFLNPEYGRKLLHWEAFDPRWGALPIVVVVAHLFLLSVYETHKNLKGPDFFIGRWRIGNASQTERPFFAELRLDRTAWRTSGDSNIPNATAEWHYTNGQVIIPWDRLDGHTALYT